MHIMRHSKVQAGEEMGKITACEMYGELWRLLGHKLNFTIDKGFWVGDKRFGWRVEDVYRDYMEKR